MQTVRLYVSGMQTVQLFKRVCYLHKGWRWSIHFPTLANSPVPRIRRAIPRSRDWFHSESHNVFIIVVTDAHNKMFSFVDAEGIAHSIDTEDTVYYMIDVDMSKVLHEVDEQCRQTFKIREILPAGAWCMMNHVCIH